MTGRCLACGTRGNVERHHPTGRYSPDAAYLDGTLTVPLCRPCHAGEHAALRRLGLDWPGDDVLDHRLRRFGAFTGGLADAGRGLVLDAGPTGALAELVLAAADREVST